MLQEDEYQRMKGELARRKTYPYILHSEPLAKEFYERFKIEVPTARYYLVQDMDKVPMQVITHDQRAEKRLWDMLKWMENAHKKAELELVTKRIEVEKSIQSKNTVLAKGKEGKRGK